MSYVLGQAETGSDGWEQVGKALAPAAGAAAGGVASSFLNLFKQPAPVVQPPSSSADLILPLVLLAGAGGVVYFLAKK